MPVWGEGETAAIWNTWLDYKSRNPAAVLTDDDVLNRLLNHEPVQYILGESWFYRRAFRVSPATLIPRPETEELCWLILKEKPNNQISFIDVCTGSGCIAVTLAAERNVWRGIAADLSADALSIAGWNAQKHSVSDRLSFRQQDFLQEFPQGDFDLIVSNPPYVHRNEAALMDSHVLDWEPHMALFPESDDVLIFYKRLSAFLGLQQNACVLWAEINPLLASATLGLFSEFRADLITDMSGKQRFLRAQNSQSSR